MKKLLLGLTLVLGTFSVNAQKIIKFEKYGNLMDRVKADGLITISDSILTLKIDYKGKVQENKFKIINKSEYETGSTYNCIGQVGTSDKHQFIFTPSFKLGIWTMINSFAIPNEKFEVYFTLSKN
jgi:adenylate kinase